MKDLPDHIPSPKDQHGPESPCSVEVVIEIPKGSFLKRGTCGTVDFVSPLPCPFNYGSVPQLIGGEGDLLDAIVLGPRLPAGSRLLIPARAALGLAERNMYDDKLVCSASALSSWDRARVLYFMHFYAFCKGLLNVSRGEQGRSYCTGWGSVAAAMERAIPVSQGWKGPRVGF